MGKFIKVENFNDHQDTMRVIIQNKKSKNALSDHVIVELVDALTTLEDDPATRFIVISGEDNVFSAGGDIKMMRSRSGMFSGDPNVLRKNYQRLIQKIPLLIENMETITIAAIDGPAIGAGLDLACMCDFRIGTKRSFYAESFTKIGLIPGIGGSFFLMRLIGYARAMELTLTGRRFDSTEALQFGLLNKVCEDAELDSSVNDYLEMLRPNSQMAMEMAKKSIRYAYLHDHRMTLDLLSSYQGICQTEDDHLDRIR
jgi:2-(1,2-epoxy-1,2-dihydrophenyl)acetyl-CoA isomerase